MQHKKLQRKTLRFFITLGILTLNSYSFGAQYIFHSIASDLNPCHFSKLKNGAMMHQMIIQRVMTNLMQLATGDHLQDACDLEALTQMAFCTTPITEQKTIERLSRSRLLNKDGSLPVDVQTVITAAISFDPKHVPLSIIRSPLAGHFIPRVKPLHCMQHNQDSPISAEYNEKYNTLILRILDRHWEKPVEKRVCLRGDDETTEDPLPYVNDHERFGFPHLGHHLAALQHAYDRQKLSSYEFHQQRLAYVAKQRLQES